MFDYYPYVSGFVTRDDAQKVADRLPRSAYARVVPYRDNYHPRVSVWKFRIEVHRFFTEPQGLYIC